MVVRWIQEEDFHSLSLILLPHKSVCFVIDFNIAGLHPLKIVMQTSWKEGMWADIPLPWNKIEISENSDGVLVLEMQTVRGLHTTAYERWGWPFYLQFCMQILYHERNCFGISVALYSSWKICWAITRKSKRCKRYILAASNMHQQRQNYIMYY